jgi:hypothetical protein
VLYSLKSSSILDRVNLSPCLLNTLAMLLALYHLIYYFTGNLISLSDLLLPAGGQLHPVQSEPVPLPTEHPTNYATSKNIIIVFVLTCLKQASLGVSQMFGLARKLLSRVSFHFHITSPKSSLVVAKCKLSSLSTAYIIDQFKHY